MRPRGQLALALTLAVSGALGGCLEGAPTFAPRGQRPPFVIAGQVVPPLGVVYEGPTQIGIDVPFRSEDVNIPLVARLYLDLVPGAEGSFQTVEREVPAGIYEDESRRVSMTWTSELEGCHSLTLILTYFDNLLPAGPLDDSRAARIVWWLNIGDADGEVTLSSCPGSAQRE